MTGHVTGHVTEPPFREAADGIMVAVRLAPRAAANRLQGVRADAEGAAVLKASVTAAPEKGKANAALLALLARAWNIPKSALSVSTGASDRRKTIHVAGEPAVLRRRLEKWLKETHGEG